MTAPDTLRLSGRGAARWRRGHPWIHRADVELAAEPVPGGRLVKVAMPKGRIVGVAAWSDQSNIALRRMPLDPEADLEAGLLRLVDAALERRAERGETTRLVNADADGLPGLVVDRYGPGLSVQTLTQAMEQRADTLLRHLREALWPQVVVLRNDVKVRTYEGLVPEKRLVLGESAVVEASMGDIRMRFDLLEGQKTGGYLDQLDNQRAAARFGRGEALDCFSYEGGFALHLAAAGLEVTAVDSSAPALERLTHNAELNSLTVATEKANVFDKLREYERAGRRFDTIVLDPPAFAPSRRTVKAARRAYKEINLRGFKLLRPGGRLVTASCSAHMTRDDFERVVAAAAHDAHRWARVVERRSAAADHPTLLGAPETDYLKALLVEVD